LTKKAACGLPFSFPVQYLIIKRIGELIASFPKAEETPQKGGLPSKKNYVKSVFERRLSGNGGRERL